MRVKKTIIREEDFGLLIWSPKLDSYFLPDQDVVNDIRQILKIKERGLTETTWQQEFDKTLVADLLTIGFESDVKYLNRSLESRLSAPLDIYYDYTHACNLRCSYCYNYFVDRKVTMSEDQIVQVLTQMSENGVMKTHLAGGEPMINLRGFETYLRTAEEVGMNVSVNCNGTLVTEKALEVVFNYGIITLTFSIDGPDAQTHDFYRGEGNFEKTRRNAKITAQEKKVRGNGPKLQYKAIHMFNTPFDVYKGLVEVAIADNMDRIQFHNPECSIYHPRGYYANPEVIKGYYERVQYVAKLQEMYPEIEIWNMWNPLVGCADIGLPGYHGCIGGQELIAIDAEGNIKPCLMNKYDLGNFFTDWVGNFRRFWTESELLADYQKMVNQVDPHCEPCEIYSQCRGGRKTRTITQNRDNYLSEPIKLEDMIGYDPYCPIDFINNQSKINIPKKREYRLNHFRRINIAHTL